jgi:osmotically-inducible protein OsmY
MLSDVASHMPSVSALRTIHGELVDRLRVNILTKDYTLKVHVKAGVVILEGDVPTALAKRAAGDDSWDTPGVADVSNQLLVVPGA